mgnify:CR=1 FL=1
MDDTTFLKLAIENSKKSMEEGNFPAGAVVAKDGKVLASAVSVPYPGLFHPDSRAVTAAFEENGPLNGATLYIGLQSCLMCTGVAYWAGIRRIVYAVPKSKVSGDYYETPEDTSKLFDTFNEKIEFVHLKECEQEALGIVREWEKKMGTEG